MRPVCLFSIGAVLLTLTAMAQEGTASLAGKVIDWSGAVVPGASLELRSEAAPEKKFSMESDTAGAFRFTGLPSDQYMLKVFMPGFKTFFVKSIPIFEGEQKLLPTMKLEVANTCGFGGAMYIRFIRYLSTPVRRGGFGGSVLRDQGPMVGNSPPVSGAEVILICGAHEVCGSTRTGPDGGFLFKALPSGTYSVRVKAKGFYPEISSDYEVHDGVEAIYYPIYIKPCFWCIPMLRPKKPRAACE